MKSPQVHAAAGLPLPGAVRTAPLSWAALAELARRFTSRASKTLAPVSSIGEAVSLGQPISRLIPGDPDIADQLYAERYGKDAGEGFIKLAWLKHFAASGKTLHALYAMDVLRDWLGAHANAADGDRAANALMALTWDGTTLARKVGGEAVLLQAINRLCRSTMQFHPKTDRGRLLRGCALLSAVTATTGLEPLRRIASDDISRALDTLVLADGGHRSGRADDLLRIIMMLQPLATALREARETIPDSLLHSLERMLPMLRMVTFDDGGLTSLRGEEAHFEAVAAVLASAQKSAQADGRPLEQAPHVGVTRLDFGETTLLADDRTMAFECASGHERLVVASIMARRQPSQLRNELVRSREGAVLRYEESLSHRRSIFLAARGLDLRCEDFLSSDECVVIDVAPGVAMTPDAATGGFRLETANHQIWTGTPRGAAAVIEDHRILLLPNSTTRDGRINWALKRISA
jgi:uncharacterized heparinase superfamily protein